MKKEAIKSIKDDIKPKRGRGYPRKFKKDSEFTEAFTQYLNHCTSNKRFPNIAGFCAFHRLTHDTFYKQKVYYPATYAIAMSQLEDEVLQYNDYRAQLYLKNKFGYTDKQDVTSHNTNTAVTKEDPAELERLMKKHNMYVIECGKKPG